MSDIVGGGITRGKGNQQVTMAFVGKVNAAEWASFVQCVVACAGKFGISVNEVSVTGLTKAAKKPKRKSGKK